jgi:hypothetical protein
VRRVVGVAAATLLALGCAHEPPPAEPWGPAGGVAPPLLLHGELVPVAGAAAAPLVAAVAEALTRSQGERGAALTLLAWAQTLPEASLRQQGGARRLVIEALVRLVGAGALSEGFEGLKALVDRLHRAAPDASETHFALGYLRWILVRDAQGRAAPARVGDDVRRELAAQFARVLALEPEFVGPLGFDAARLRAELATISAPPREGAALAPPAAASPSAL